MTDNGGVPAHSVTYDPHASSTAQTVPLGMVWRRFLYDLEQRCETIPEYGTQEREAYYRALVLDQRYGLLAGAISIMCKKAVGWQWELEGGAEGMREWLHAGLTERAEFGAGYTALLDLAAREFFTQDKGAFIEIMDLTFPGESGKRAPLRPPALGLRHLDSACCAITRDPNWPVIYYNPRTGKRHVLHRSRVIHITDQPNPAWQYAGMGQCATARVLQRARIAARQNQLEDERMADMPPPGIAVFDNARLGDVQGEYKQQLAESGYSVFRDIMAVESLDPNRPVDVRFIRFASLPEGFNPHREFILTMLVFALAFGEDVRTFTALSEGELGTAAEAEVKREVARGMGAAYLRAQWAENMNNLYLRTRETGVSWRWLEQDEAQEEQQANIAKLRVEALEKAFTSGMIKLDEARRELAGVGILDEEDLASDDEETDTTKGQTSERRTPDKLTYTPETLGAPTTFTDEDVRITRRDIRRELELWRSIPELAPYVPADPDEITLPARQSRQESVVIPEGSRADLAALRADLARGETTALCGRLARGEIDLATWQADARAILKDLHTAEMAIGKGGWAYVTQSDWGRVGAELRGQYAFLDNFARDILFAAEQGVTYSEAYLTNRLGMYVDAANASFNRGVYASQGFNPAELPAVPGDGSTLCKTRCQCRWEFRETGDGIYEAHWMLGDADHCSTCLDRAANWTPWGTIGSEVV